MSPLLRRFACIGLFIAGPVNAQGSLPTQIPPVPSDGECLSLGRPSGPLSFSPGERLEYTLDAMGADAGSLVIRVGAPQKNALPVKASVQTNTFFSKIRKVSGEAQSLLNRSSLRPIRYQEASVENGIPRSADVQFFHKNKRAEAKFQIRKRTGKQQFQYAHDGLDALSAVFLMRQLQPKVGQELCFDAYGVRRMWRVWGSVQGKEEIPTPFGDIEAWHWAGQAAYSKSSKRRREVHLWISADKRRLPLVALGMIDLGAVRATLKAYAKKGKSVLRAQGAESLKW